MRQMFNNLTETINSSIKTAADSFFIHLKHVSGLTTSRSTLREPVKTSCVSPAGARNQPLVQLQRKSLQLQSSHNYTALSAALTTARTQYEVGGFPFLLGQETNSSGRCLLRSHRRLLRKLVIFTHSFPLRPQERKRAGRT